MFILTDLKYLSCIVMDYEPSTDTLKVLMCPYCIIQFLKKKRIIHCFKILQKSHDNMIGYL